MSEQGLYFKMVDLFGNNQRLSAFYEFGVNEAGSEGSDESWSGFFYNSALTNNTGLHKCYVIGSEDNSSIDAESNIYYITGSSSNLTGGYKIDLETLNANNISAIIDFEFAGDVTGGVLLGCLHTGFESDGFSTDPVDLAYSSGFNIGVTDRGHLFCQTLNQKGASIKVIHDIELSKRNILGVSVYGSSIMVSNYDYMNDLVKVSEVFTESDFISNSGGDLFLGKTETFYIDDPVFSGHINNFSLFSGFVDPQVLKELGEGILGDYSYNAASSQSQYYVTGFSETISYKTGVTGYEYEATGSLTVETGREIFTGSFSSDEQPTENKEEGERYYKYYTLNNGSSKTFYKEELGMLNSNSGYIYYPTGENAYDTLGLNDISESIQTYAETSGIARRGGSNETSISLHRKVALTGFLNEISGVVQTPLTGEMVVNIPASSGVVLEGESRDLKKDYIYYMGKR